MQGAKTLTSCSKTKFIDGMKKENLAVLCSPPAPRKVHAPKTIKVSSFDNRKSCHSKPDMMSVMVQANEQDIKASTCKSSSIGICHPQPMELIDDDCIEVTNIGCSNVDTKPKKKKWTLKLSMG